MLRMHGTDYRSGLARLHEQVDRLGLDDYVSVGGPIHAEAKEAFLRHADAYIHPSNWESHSVALVKVLERGIPAVVSSSIHIAPVLVEADAAVVSEIAPDALDLAMQRVETGSASEQSLSSAEVLTGVLSYRRGMMRYRIDSGVLNSLRWPAISQALSSLSNVAISLAIVRVATTAKPGSTEECGVLIVF